VQLPPVDTVAAGSAGQYRFLLAALVVVHDMAETYEPMNPRGSIWRRQEAPM
jgi:hypothetical protein